MAVISKKILEIIKNNSGLILNGAHQNYISSYVFERLKELNLTEEEYEKYLSKSNYELTMLINAAAINETYFFREQIQFEFLDRVYFPKYSKNEKPLYIWSGACSSGEEALSIYSLCKKHDVKAKIYASDIDTNIISQFVALNYTDKSFRNDGKKFHALLNQLGTFNNPGNGSHDKTFSADSSILEDFFVQNINLCRNFNPSGQKLDLIFIRNVFIYFDSDMQKKILLNAADLMEKDALLFVSVNEIGQIGLIKDIPFAVEKWESVYYLRRL